MSYKQEYYLKLAKTKLQGGDLGGMIAALYRALIVALKNMSIQRHPKTNISSTLAPVKSTPVKSTPVVTNLPEPTINEVAPVEEIIAESKVEATISRTSFSNYDWENEYNLITDVPLGYSSTAKIDLDLSGGNILLVNDILKKDIDSLLVGATQLNDTYFISINDYRNTLSKWGKHFNYVAEDVYDSNAVIRNLYYTLKEYNSKDAFFDNNIFLVITNIETIEEPYSQMVKSLLEEGKGYGIFVITTTSKANENKVLSLYGINSFEYIINFNFTGSTLFSLSSSNSTIFNSYNFDRKDIEYLNTKNKSDLGYILNVDVFKLLNSIEVINDIDEVGITDELSMLLLNSNPQEDFEKLSFEEIENLMRIFLTSKKEYANFILSYSKTIGEEQLESLLLFLDKTLQKGQVNKIIIPSVDIKDSYTELKVVLPEIHSYNPSELDSIFLEALSEGEWKHLTDLSDEEVNKTVELFDVNSTKVKDVPATPLKEKNIQDNTPVSDIIDTSTKISEEEILVYMKATGIKSREKALNILLKD